MYTVKCYELKNICFILCMYTVKCYELKNVLFLVKKKIDVELYIIIFFFKIFFLRHSQLRIALDKNIIKNILMYWERERERERERDTDDLFWDTHS
jgi:hypothetical protein